MKVNCNIINNYDDVDEYQQIIQTVLEAGYLHQNIDFNMVTSIVLINNQNIKEMNKLYRMKDYATDVLSFPNNENDELGDIFISIDKAKEQAKEYGHSFERELGFLTVHGFLHIIGYDHLTKEEEIIMFKTQEEILNTISLKR